MLKSIYKPSKIKNSSLKGNGNKNRFLNNTLKKLRFSSIFIVFLLNFILNIFKPNKDLPIVVFKKNSNKKKYKNVKMDANIALSKIRELTLLNPRSISISLIKGRYIIKEIIKKSIKNALNLINGLTIAYLLLIIDDILIYEKS